MTNSWFNKHFNSLFDFVNEHDPDLLAQWLAQYEEAKE
jgi:hypothetical protein